VIDEVDPPVSAKFLRGYYGMDATLLFVESRSDGG
jgi:hypothetical protein